MVAAEAALTEAETGYVQAARAADTVRGYRSDWAAPSAEQTTRKDRCPPAEHLSDKVA
ncbi:hypothetical protein [Mycobacterium intracellulare]|uniref:hypothetical protein n=1 Tax=Mycobacterium intracellulare TaxID=1767 RepID=UPI001444C9B9|nr:hypothetical protein [Mycobacterium intracellulare]